MMEDRLLIVIETDQGAAAGDVAELLRATAAAFERFSKTRTGRSPILTVEALEQGSLKIVLDAVDLMDKLSGAGQLLAPFAAHIAELVRGALAARGFIRMTPSDRKLLQALSGPVAKGRARQINIIADRGATIVIDEAAARVLVGALEARQEQPLRTRPPEIDDVQRLAPALSGPGVHGTAMLVRGTWYARLEGGQGVLVPLHGAASADLVDGGAHLFRGTLIKGRFGEVIGLELHSAAPL